ncbi:protein tyrosine phosphatase family protein [Alcanivorax sp. JB21]|uniref:protein tyrosine phosphatase family protein n=1 Tax=Alcanivorax limicola TaxID=2874102 RepID=UPI001CBD6C4E|nr:protein tyrosine phosphatase family protein [Alcanivorax limicola]MBZ2190051.1 protein tyrosine phosphatase family protein [Alcanivorax limicola]
MPQDRIRHLGMWVRSAGQWLRHRVSLPWRGQHPRGIYNFLALGPQLLTSGQPTEKQLARLRDSGVETVINLAPVTADNALPDEAGTVAALGMRYVHIPVDFAAPSDADFRRFCDAMASRGEGRVLVHCAANMRVSAFMYRYRCEVLAEPPERARRDLHRIWRPQGVWGDFIAPRIAPRNSE